MADSFARGLDVAEPVTNPRTVITTGTTFLAILGLYLLGGDVLRGFSFTLLIGLIVGTYSTIYIASPVVVWWDSRKGAAASSAPAKAAL